MKKQFFFFLFLFFSTLAFAQFSLDSLRLVLPEITKIDTFGLSNTGKYLWILDDPNVYILDSKSRRVVRSFHSQSGDYAEVDFNYSDEYVLISYSWLYETHIYSLKSGEKVRTVKLGYHNTFSSFINMSNSFIYSPSHAYDKNHTFIIENLDDLSYKDSISIILNRNSFDGKNNPSFNGTCIRYLDQRGDVTYFDVVERVNKKSNLIYEEHKIDNRNRLPDKSLFAVNKLIWSPLISVDYSIDERKISLTGNGPKALNQIFLYPELNFKNDSFYYQNKFWWSSDLHDKKNIKEGGLRLYFSFMGGMDSLDLNLPSSIKYFRDSIEVEFNINEAESICRNGDFFALSKYNILDSSTTVLILEQSEIHSGIIRAVRQIKKRINHLYFVDKKGESFVYKSPGIPDFSDRSCINYTTTDGYLDSELSMELLDSLINSNDDYDIQVLDSCHLLLFSKYFSQIKLEQTNVYILDVCYKSLDWLNLDLVTPIAALSVISSLNAIVILDLNNLISFRSLSDFTVKLYIHLLENNNWLVKLPNSPYYMCSKDASKMLHYVTPSLKVIGFEQLDPVYNRPDIVLDSIGKYFGGADQELVANYRESWEKRIDRLGLDKEKLGKGEIAVPSAEIIGADQIAYENKEGKVEIKVEGIDSKYSLRRFNVYVNEVPLYGSLGISISQLQAHKWDTTLTVPLSFGENKIQVSVMNELGLENFKYPTYVNYIPVTDAVVAKTHYIGIGVNSFINKQYNLTYCVKDVNDLASALGGENTRVKILTDQQVTRENILQLKQYLKDSTTVNDKVIISCSSHGLLDDSLNFYLATHDVDFKHPELRGLKYEELESLLDGIPARQKLLLLDACNSGENDKTELLTNELAKKESKMNGTEVLAARGVIIQLEEENKNNFKKMNELFVNVRNNTGSVIISAAGGQESALEAIEIDGKKIENGAFTYSVLEYLKSNEGNQDALTVNKLKQYVENRVEELTEGKQKPTSRQETMEVDWRLR